MTTLFFVRHGETDWNRQGRFQGVQDIPLNEEGRRQARQLAAAWNLGGEVLVSSPLSRALETAQILGAALGLTLRRPDPSLVERDYGRGAGLTKEERLAQFPDGVVPGIESPAAVQARAQAFLDAASLEHPGRRVIVVSHGGFINAVLSVVTRGDLGTGKTILGNASVTTVVLGAGGWSVPTVGMTYSADVLGLRE